PAQVINGRANPPYRRHQLGGAGRPGVFDRPAPPPARGSRRPALALRRPRRFRGSHGRPRPALRPPVDPPAAPRRLLPGRVPADRFQYPRAPDPRLARRAAGRNPDRRRPGDVRRRRDRLAPALRAPAPERRAVRLLLDVLLPGADPRVHPLAQGPRDRPAVRLHADGLLLRVLRGLLPASGPRPAVRAGPAVHGLDRDLAGFADDLGDDQPAG